MQIPPDRDSSLLRALLALTRRSPIAITKPAIDWPAGFTKADIAVLDWIAAEGRRVRRLDIS